VARLIARNIAHITRTKAFLDSTPVPLDIVLYTPGGLVLAAIQIARAIHDHKATVTVFVPHYAMSGGTLIALAAWRHGRLTAQSLRMTAPPRPGACAAFEPGSAVEEQ
jgi:ATP-dependent protease ClpP protease subunit